jgi:hypothetical protein
LKQASIDRVCELIEKYGTFNGNVMGCDTYVVFAEDFARIIVEELQIDTLHKRRNENKRLRAKIARLRAHLDRFAEQLEDCYGH